MTNDDRFALLEMDTPPRLPLTGAAARIASAARGEVGAEALRASRPQYERLGAVQPLDARPVVEAPAARPVVASRPELNKAMVAGAALGATGRLFSWLGRRPLTRAQICSALEHAGLPTTWAPAPKSAVAQLGRAVGQVALRAQLVPRAVRKASMQGSWLCRWQVGTVSGADVGQPYGSVVMTITLHSDDDLRIDAPACGDLAEEVRERYDQLLTQESYDAADVTAWLRRTIVDRCGGATLGVALWVPERAVGDDWRAAERLCTALRNLGWGTTWMLPGIPVVGGNELAEGLAEGLIDELRDLAAEVNRSKGGAACRAQVEAADKLRLRAVALGEVLGAARLAQVTACITQLVEVVRSGNTDVELRAQALEF